VFPSCNEPGLEVVQALVRSNKVGVYGGSSGDVTYDPSRHILSHHSVYPSLYDKRFRQKFEPMLKKLRITFVFPTVDVLVAEFAKWKTPGVTFITPDADTATLVLSKKATYERLRGVIPVPEVFKSDGDVEFPAYAKPDVGSGSKTAHIVRTPDDLAAARNEGLLVCQYLPGVEYTVDAVNDLSGKLLYAGVRVRGKIGRGIALGTQTVQDKEIMQMMYKISEKVRIMGPWFAQFKRDAHGIPTLLEINCRVGGSSTLTRLSGVNIPLLSLFLFAGYPVAIPEARRGLLVNRALVNYCDPPEVAHVIWDLDDTLLRKDGRPDPESMAALHDLKNRGVRQYLVSRKPAIRKTLSHHSIPELFTEIVSTVDKTRQIGKLMKKHRMKQAECAVINDSVIENLTLARRFPEAIIITPDALAVLGREKIA